MDLNRTALQKRQALPRSNDFSIAELQQMPPYFGWVECCPAPGVAFRMLLGGADDGVALRFFWNGGYERKTLALWTQFAARDGWVIDVGAHTGAYTLAALAVKKKPRVISFEPHFMNYARLNLNLRANGFVTDHAFMLAAGARNEQRVFTVRATRDYLSTGGSLDARPGDERWQRSYVQVASLDSFVAAQSAEIALLKLDVEGHEADCIEGARNLIARSEPDIFFETVTQPVATRVQTLLGGLGYRFFEIDDLAGTVAETDTVKSYRDASGRPVMSRLNCIASRRNVDLLAAAAP